MVIALRTMVRPWMVAILQVLPLLLLLLPLTDRSFGIGRPAGAVATAATVVAHAEAAPATTGDETDATAVDANTTEVSVGCNYKGRSYEPGTLVNTDQPCLKCTCVIGNLVCHLQVCPELPDPPPQGCVIVHKKNKCCAHLQCYYEQLGAVHSKLFSLQNVSRSGPARMENSAFMTFNGLSKGCVVNGTIYAEGSAMGSSSLCEYCYCIKGHQQCVRPQCSLNIPGCTAVYKKHTCCPIKYKCSPPHNALIKNTTEAPSTEMPSSLSARLKDCRINGRLISLGEPVIGVARSSCETCFCINGQVRCDKVICPPIRAQISPNCGPVYSEGHCCPTSYNCSSSTSNNESHVSSTTATMMTTTTPTTTTITSSSTVTIDMPSSSPLSLTSTPSSSPQTMSTNMLAETESTSNVIVNDSKNDTDLMIEDPMESRHANPASLMQDDFGGLNVTEKSNNFEMDYYEPTLPPSLPNLKIIPFVAADAVVDKPAAVYDNYQPEVERVYNVSEVEETPLSALNSFSPPIETEGGFMPKDPPDGAIYVPDKFRTTTEHHVPIIPVQSTTTVHYDKPVVGHRPMGSVWCMSNGKKYKHGELLTDPSACNICICFNANIVCQENCPAVKVGCQRISDPSNSTCCGRIICNESEDDVTTEHVKLTELTSETATITTKHKDAFIEHIVYFAPPTDKPVSTPLPATTVKHFISSEPTTLKPLTSTVKLITTLAPITTEKLTVFSSVPTKRVEITTPVPKPTDDEDYSFESMFSFLFSSDTQEQSSSTPSQITSTNNIEAETRIEHRTDDEIDEKVHLVDTKPQNNSVTLSELFKTNQNSNTEKYLNIHHTDNKESSGIKQNSENKNNKLEPQDVNKPVEVKPNSEINKHVDFKPHFEIKQNTDANSDSETKYKIGAKPHSEIKQHVDMKTNLETKPHVKASLHSGVNQQAEVKTQFEVKENDQNSSQFNFKYHDEVKPYQDLSKHQTEVKSHFDVQEHSEVKPHSNLKHESDVKIYPDYKYPTEIKSQFDVKDKVVVKPYFDLKQHTAEVTTFSAFKQHGDESSLPEIKHHNEIKQNVSAKPLKTKVDTEFNLVASMLKISGCNIYGRMYRVGKIIAELSNPCLECMCTEIGVHCNQLKC